MNQPKFINKLFNLFRRYSGTEEINKYSQVAQAEIHKKNETNLDNDIYSNMLSMIYQFDADNYNITPEAKKADRLRVYRMMSNNEVVSNCLEDITDNFLNHDNDGNFIRLIFNNNRLSPEERKFLEDKFRLFMLLFNFDLNIYQYLMTYLIEGELCFELVVNPDRLDYGIIGLKFIPNEKYGFLKANNQLVGIIYDSSKDESQVYSNLDSGAIFSKIALPGNLYSIYKGSRSLEENKVPFLFEQLFYVNTGNYSSDKMFVLPILEKIRVAFIRLNLIEDALIIYRITRSPERFLFNIACGDMPRAKAEQMLLQIMQRFQTRKGASFPKDGAGQIFNKYDTLSALESFFFLKPEGSEGTTVQSFGKQATFGEIDDIEYFLKKIYVGLSVPYRMKEPNVEIKRNTNLISYDEFKFAKMIIRIQNTFAEAIKRTFITHLKLTGLYNKLTLTPFDFTIRFNQPINYDLYLQQEKNNQLIDTYNRLSGDDSISKTYLQKKFLNMTESDIIENEKLKISDMLKNQLRETLREKIAELVSNSVNQILSNITQEEAFSLGEPEPHGFESELRRTSPFGGGGLKPEIGGRNEQEAVGGIEAGGETAGGGIAAKGEEGGIGGSEEAGGEALPSDIDKLLGI